VRASDRYAPENLKHKLTEEQPGTGPLARVFGSCITSQIVYFFGVLFSSNVCMANC
jgi:hypothetical protein